MQKIFPLVKMGNENGAMDFVDVVVIVETSVWPGGVPALLMAESNTAMNTYKIGDILIPSLDAAMEIAACMALLLCVGLDGFCR